MRISPILAAWSIAALLRLAVGSATVAAITAAGMVLPLIPGSGVAPELLVIATTSGSLMFSHMNDIGFWMFKEYYNATVRQTFQIWTVMESIVALVGLAGVFLLSLFVTAPAGGAAAAGRVFYVNSYHEGYPSSDDTMRAIRDALGSRGIELQVFFLDAKRHPAAAEIEARARQAEGRDPGFPAGRADRLRRRCGQVRGAAVLSGMARYRWCSAGSTGRPSSTACLPAT